MSVFSLSLQIWRPKEGQAPGRSHLWLMTSRSLSRDSISNCDSIWMISRLTKSTFHCRLNYGINDTNYMLVMPAWLKEKVAAVYHSYKYKCNDLFHLKLSTSFFNLQLARTFVHMALKNSMSVQHKKTNSHFNQHHLQLFFCSIASFRPVIQSVALSYKSLFLWYS